MSRLRTIATGRLLAICAVLVLGLSGVATLAIAASGGGPTPPQKPLAQAIRDALAGAAPAGVTARVTFTNSLLTGGGASQGANPLLAGAKGRMWVSADGDARLELQSQSGGGDSQLILKGDRLTIFDAASATLYRATLPAHADAPAAADTPPTLTAVERALGRLARWATVGDATPTNIAGREAYTVRLAPRRDGGLVGGASIAWDAANGAPLRAAVYAAGRNDPVLELVATDVGFGAVDPSVFDIAPPADASVVDLNPADGAAAPTDKAPAEPITGLDAVRARVGFTLSAPATLAGMDRSKVALIERDGHQGAIVTYGQGLGGIAVLQSPVKPGDEPADTPAPRDGGLATLDLGGGVTGLELETALGTAITFSRAGVRYVVVGSVTGDVARAAARGL